MFRKFLKSALLITFTFCFVINSNAKVVEKILAIVNDDIITKTEFDERISKNIEIFRRLYNLDEKRLLEEIEKAKPEIFETMIDELLFTQEAVKKGIQIQDSEVEQYINTLSKQYGNDEAFQKALDAEGYTLESLRKERHRALLLQELIKREFETETDVSDEEVRTYYRENIDKFPNRSDSVKLKHIFVKFDITDADKNSTLVKAQDILKKCKEGADFGEMASQYSDHELTKESGGDLGYFVPGMGKYDPALEDVASKLTVGQISDLIESPGGYDIIKVTDIQNGSVRAQRIYIAIVPSPESEKASLQKAQSILEELNKGADFVEMVKKYSEDPSTKEKDGDWRDVPIDSMGPELRNAFKSFSEGEISQPVRTPFGFHIFKVIKRQDLSDEEIDQIRQFLTQNKLQEKIGEYSKKLKETAYIIRKSLEN
jgi:peptidyl-prolyl cis-trans isomerase SurA